MLLGRSDPLRLFEELSSELGHHRTRAHVYVIGGAAMSLACARNRLTEDVDARFDAGHYRLAQAVRSVARRRGLPEDWLNEQAVSAIPRSPDGMARTLYSSPSLTVTGASPNHLLAVKLRAGRRRDREDIHRLVDLLDLREPDEGRRIHDQLFFGEAIPPTGQGYLEEACSGRAGADSEQPRT